MKKEYILESDRRFDSVPNTNNVTLDKFISFGKGISSFVKRRQQYLLMAFWRLIKDGVSKTNYTERSDQ